MFKFKLGRKQPEETEARRRLQQELFAFHKISDRGFPSRPSAIAYDPQLNLIAIGTHTGEIRIYGQPSFQLSFNLDPSSVRKLLFLNGLARLLVLTTDGYFHLLEVNNTNPIRLDRICTSNEEDGMILKNIQTMCLLRNNIQLLIGLDNGNIYSFNMDSFSLDTNAIIPTEMIEKTIGEYCNGRVVHPGSVQSIAQHPINADKILIGYKNTVIVHWDLPSNSYDRTYIYKHEVESACWYNQGMNFATCHSNGSYALWDVRQQLNIVETEKIPYGPYPCTPMTKICVKTMRNDDPLIIFSGGLPRSSYANKHSVTCQCENEHNPERTRHVTFDFTTSVIDFFTIDKLSNNGARDDPQSLVILLNEEIVVIDLLTDSWPLYSLPYLNSIHASPIICASLVSDIKQEFYQKLVTYAAAQFEDYSDRKWPITGGEVTSEENDSQEKYLLLTGHEDGSVQFWDVTNTSMPLIYKLKTSDYFQIEQAPIDDADEETWPPFRKTGLFDPYCDDPRLAVQKLSLCTDTSILIVAGTAGQVLTFQFTSESMEVNLPTTNVNLLDGCESFVWKGHEEMKTRATSVVPGLYATSFIQLYPPAAVSALALCSDIQSYAVGTAHGFAIINYQENRVLTARCTLDPNALGNTSTVSQSTGESTLIRGRSLKKSLRESFRRFRKGRTIKKSTMARIDETLRLEEIARAPIERQVEFREFKPIDDQINTMVRCLYFAKTYLNSINDRTRSLWVGTNGGHVYVYSIVGLEPQSNTGPAIAMDYTNTCSLAKEIRLKHKAPVLSIAVLDGSNQSVGQGSNIPLVTNIDIPINPEHVNTHRVLICSEEQFKVFTLPQLKPFCKHKLTAIEGTRVRKISINHFTHKTDNSTESHSESCLVCLDNMGQISIFALPTLRRQILFNCIKPTDISALSSFQFTSNAHAFYLQSSSELAEVSFTTERNSVSTMGISFEKISRKTLSRTVNEKHQETPSKDSMTSSSSTRKSIEPEEPVSITTVKSSPNGNNSGFSINSDSAIDVQSSNDEGIKSIEHDSVRNFSPKSSKKSAAPPPPIPPKPVSIKVRQAPTINGAHTTALHT